MKHKIFYDPCQDLKKRGSTGEFLLLHSTDICLMVL